MSGWTSGAPPTTVLTVGHIPSQKAYRYCTGDEEDLLTLLGQDTTDKYLRIEFTGATIRFPHHFTSERIIEALNYWLPKYSLIVLPEVMLHAPEANLQEIHEGLARLTDIVPPILESQFVGKSTTDDPYYPYGYWQLVDRTGPHMGRVTRLFTQEEKEEQNRLLIALGCMLQEIPAEKLKEAQKAAESYYTHGTVLGFYAAYQPLNELLRLLGYRFRLIYHHHLHISTSLYRSLQQRLRQRLAEQNHPGWLAPQADIAFLVEALRLLQKQQPEKVEAFKEQLLGTPNLL